MSDSYILDFKIMVNCEFKRIQLLKLIKKRIAGYKTVFEYSFEYRDNLFRFRFNEDYDPCKVDEEDGYLYYRYEIEVVSLKDNENIKNQLDLARKFKEHFIEIGCSAEICADFEELL